MENIPRLFGGRIAHIKLESALLMILHNHRKPKHDRGSVQNIVDAYQRERRLIRGGAGSATGSSGIVAKGRGANAQKKKGK